MATAIKPTQKPGVEEAEAAPIHRIRITLTSKNVKNLEKGGCWAAWRWLACCGRAERAGWWARGRERRGRGSLGGAGSLGHLRHRRAAAAAAWPLLSAAASRWLARGARPCCLPRPAALLLPTQCVPT